MKRGILGFFIIFIVYGNNIFSQHLSHQVLVPLAGIATDNKISYSQTVGETAVEVVGCVRYVFTQGFQQPGIKFTPEIPPPGTGVSVYPNPATDQITIELFGDLARTFRIEIINITGNIVLSFKREFFCSYWHFEQQNISNLIRGFYLVRIISDDRMINRTFRIEKI